MRKNLMVILVLACAVSGCASTRSPGAGGGTSINLAPDRAKSCYGGPVYVPC